MPDSSDPKAYIRRPAAVIIVTMLAWFGATYLGGQYNWPIKWAFLVDFAALGAFLWALIVLFWGWRNATSDDR